VLELLIVMALFLILAGLILAGLGAAMESGRKTQVFSAMRALKAAHDEYIAEVGEPVNLEGSYPFSPDDAEPTVPPPDRPNNVAPAPETSIEIFIAAVSQTQTGERIIDGLSDDMLVDNDDNGFLEVRDPWDNNLEYRPSTLGDNELYRNVPFDDTDPAYELMERAEPFFASAGKDGKWETPGQNDRTDDIYSFGISQ
jgi:type II secretory pathway pseudopilin PulG